jgi:hypothetical protein
MQSEKDLLQNDLSKLEENKDTAGLEQFAEDASLLGYEDVATKARESIQKINEASAAIETISAAEATNVENLGGTTQELSVRTGEVDQKIENVKKDATQEIESLKAESEGNQSNESLPQSVSETALEQKTEMQPEGAQGIAPQSEAEKSAQEAMEAQKQKKFESFKNWRAGDVETEKNNPDNPINKVLKAAEENKEIMKDVLSSTGYNTFDSLIKNKLNLTPEQLDAAMPDLYEKGLVPIESYRYYLNMKSLNGNSVNLPKVNQMVEIMPKELVMKLTEDKMSENILNAWQDGVSNEIAKELKKEDEWTKSYENPLKLITLVANAARFEDKASIEATVDKVVEAYTNNNPNFGQLQNRQDGSFPVLENLCEAGFTEQALKIMEKGLGKGLPTKPIWELHEKGYISEEQVKELFNKNGMLQ